MKKKLLIASVAVLMVSPVLTSCVDNEESPSVTAIRDAKAAQLNSLAKLNNAKADAEKVMAEANARLINAQAALQEAIANLKDLELQKAKATAEVEIQAAILRAQADLKRAEAEFEIANAELISASASVSEAERERINTLLGSATTALGELNTLKSDLVTKKGEKISAEFDLVDLEYLKNQNVSNNNGKIATYNAIITELEKLDNTDKASAKEAYDKANAEYLRLDEIAIKETNKYTNAWQTLEDNRLLVDGAAFTSDNNMRYLTPEYVENISKPIIYDNGTNGGVYTVRGYNKYIVNNTLLSNDLDNYAKNVSIAKTYLAEETKKFSDYKNTDGYKLLLKELTDAEKAYSEAKTSQEKIDAQNRVNSAKYSIEAANQPFENNITSAEQNLNSHEKQLAMLNKINTSLTGEDAKLYAELLVNYDKSREVACDAYIAYTKAQYNKNLQSELTNTLSMIYNNIKDIVQEIARYRNLISGLEKNNADYSQIKTKEQLIAKYESEIANLETQIKAKELIYNGIKAEIDAIINK